MQLKELLDQWTLDFAVNCTGIATIDIFDHHWLLVCVVLVSRARALYVIYFRHSTVRSGALRQ